MPTALHTDFQHFQVTTGSRVRQFVMTAVFVALYPLRHTEHYAQVWNYFALTDTVAFMHFKTASLLECEVPQQAAG